MEFELKTMYFWRFLVPLISTILVLWGIEVIITRVPPSSVDGIPMIGGALKKLLR